jgi:serine/threonine-protein kinase
MAIRDSEHEADAHSALTLASPASVSTLPPPAPSSAPGGTLGGRYEIRRELGKGGMGAVYEAIHVSLGTRVAIKTMLPIFAELPEIERRFRREARALSMLSHPNVVRVIDFGEDVSPTARTAYLVMEYLEGRSLSDWVLESPGLLSMRHVVDVMTMILDGLEAAHALGIIHRDLKPDNVFITHEAGRRVAKIVDFGLAHVDDERDAGPTLTQRDTVAGTPQYMSPEQCRSLRVGPASDVYATGCILTFLLQKAPPFDAASPVETMARHMFSSPPSLTRPAGAEPVPAALERLRLDMLAKNPELRVKSAAEARERLAVALHREPDGRKSSAPTRGDLATPTLAPMSAPPLEGQTVVTFVAARAPSAEDRTGLEAQGITPRVVASASEVEAGAAGVVVIDLGDDLEAVRAALEDLRARAPKLAMLVCAPGVTIEDINTFVERGAADVLRMPAGVDAVARRVQRLLRRKR